MPDPRTAGIPMPVGWHMSAFNDDTDVAIDVAVQAVARCHSCGVTAPFGIGEVRGSARDYVDGPYRTGLKAAWDWTDEHITTCPKARTSTVPSSTRPLADSAI